MGERFAPPDDRAAGRALGGGADPGADERRARRARSSRSRFVRAGGAAGPEAARRLFARLDAARVWCQLEQVAIVSADTLPPREESVEAPAVPLVEAWDRLLDDAARSTGATCSAPSTSTRALCCPAPRSSRPRSTPPVRPTGSASRSAARSGSDTASRRKWRDARSSGSTPRGSSARIELLRVVCDTDHVGTQGAVWYVGGKVL